MSNQAERSAYALPATSAQIAGAPRPGTVLSAAGLLAALATSSCCLLPFLFVTLGVSGAWIGNLTVLAPSQPIFFSLAAVLIGAGFLRVYRRPKAAPCVPGSACADPRADWVTKAVLWGAAILAVAGMAVPWIVGLMMQA